MKQRNKAIAAGLVGLALIAATPGTFATWFDTQEIQVGAIQTGTLELNVSDDSTDGWLFNGERRDDLQGIQWIPGHVATASLIVEPELVGDGLTAELQITEAPGDNSFELKEDGHIYYEGEPTNLFAQIAIDGAEFGERRTLTADDTVGPISLEVRIWFSGAQEHRLGMGINPDLGNLVIRLQQVNVPSAN